jgi:hypothetical protein
MTATNGILAIAACMLLPGLLILEGAETRICSFGRLAFAVALSATFNHFLVVFLVLTGLYQRSVVVGLAAGELGLLVVLMFVRRPRGEENYGLSFRKAIALIPMAVGLLSAVVIAYVIWTYGSLAFHDFGEIFTGWDAVVSWNRWAGEWAAGSLPVQTWEYPQLLPSLWSMIYVMMGTTELQIFPKAMMAWLPIIMFFAFADMACAGRAIIGSVAAYSGLKLLLLFNTFAMSGYAELPSGIMAFLALYAGYQASGDKSAASDRLALFGAAIVAGAALTKQSGLFFALLYPFFLWLVSPKGSATRIWRTISIILLLTAPWYLYRAYAIRYGGDASNILVVTQLIHAGRSYAERILFGAHLIVGSLNGPFLYCVIGLLVLALWSHLGRILTLVVIFPYILIYGLFFSYDIRNILPIVPVVAWAMGIGTANALDLFPMRLLISKASCWQRKVSCPTLSKWLVLRSPVPLAFAFLLLLGVSAFAWVGRWPDRDLLVTDQNRRLTTLGDSAVNQAVIEFVESKRPTGKILTNDGLLEFIPLLKPYYRGYVFGPWTTEEGLAQVIKNERISAILIIGGAPPQLQVTLEHWASEYRVKFRAGVTGTWQFFEVAETEP